MDSLSVPDRTLADRLLNFLVTPSRTKIAWQVSDLAHYAEAPVVRAQELLQRLAGPDFRILRRVERHADDRSDVVVFELYHDILADGILGWLGERKRRGKRIVICCDGTWSREDNAYITNVQKLARSVAGDPALTDGVQQLVFYLSAIASNPLSRLGWRWGYGLHGNVLALYRFLAQNYEPGDEIFVFGFSRGAFAARSLVGMLGRVGLLTWRAVNDQKLPEASARFRGTGAAHDFEASAAAFVKDYSHPGVQVSFLGIFETVGSLGVPRAMRRAAVFHDLQLSLIVQCARQALAIDEPRTSLPPCLWESPEGETQDPRIRQVWFEGAHADVGGGYRSTGLSDTTLLWMAREAAREGLVFDEALLGDYVASGSDAVRHSPNRLRDRLVHVLRQVFRATRARDREKYIAGCRRLNPAGAVSVRVASTAVEHFRESGGYRPPNLGQFLAECHDASDLVEPVIGLPQPTLDEHDLAQLLLSQDSMGPIAQA